MSIITGLLLAGGALVVGFIGGFYVGKFVEFKRKKV